MEGWFASGLCMDLAMEQLPNRRLYLSGLGSQARQKVCVLQAQVHRRAAKDEMSRMTALWSCIPRQRPEKN
jgi:hypothetical protein